MGAVGFYVRKNRFNTILDGDFAERYDLKLYQEGLKDQLNRLPTLGGGSATRPPFKFIDNVKAGEEHTDHIFIPFEQDENNKYMLLFGNQYIHVYKNDARITSVEIATPYTTDEVRDIRAAIFTKTMFIVHPNHMVRALINIDGSDTNWDFGVVAAADGPYGEAKADGTISITGDSGTVTVDATLANTFYSTDTAGAGGTGVYNSHIRILDGTTWYWGRIVSYNSDTQVTVALQDDEEGNPVTLSDPALTGLTFRLGAWSTTSGFPRTISAFEGRAVYGGTVNRPDTIWFSELDDYISFRPSFQDGTVGASLAVTVTLASAKLANIRWMLGRSSLIVGTSEGEHIVELNAGSDSTTPKAVQQSSEGSAPLPVLEAASGNIFFSDDGASVFEIVYDFQVDSFVPAKLSSLAEGLLTSGITTSCFQKKPYKLIWLSMTDGSMIAVSYNKEQKVIGFSRHQCGGEGKVIALGALTKPVNDKVYAVVNRVINGNNVSTVEILDDFKINNKFESIFMDSYNVVVAETPPYTVTFNVNNAYINTVSLITYQAGWHIVVRDPETNALTFKALITETNISGNPNRFTYEILAGDLTPSFTLPAGTWFIARNTFNFSRLAGETIDIKSDGGYIGEYPVDATFDIVTLDTADHTTVYGGFKYQQLEQSLPFVSPESIQGYNNLSTISNFRIKVDKSVLADVSFNGGNYRPAAIRSGDDTMDEGPELFTGVLDFDDASSSEEPYYTIRVTEPHPLKILAISFLLSINLEGAT